MMPDRTCGHSDTLNSTVTGAAWRRGRLAAASIQRTSLRCLCGCKRLPHALQLNGHRESDSERWVVKSALWGAPVRLGTTGHIYANEVDAPGILNMKHLIVGRVKPLHGKIPH